jgi:hypothetical protein
MVKENKNDLKVSVVFRRVSVLIFFKLIQYLIISINCSTRGREACQQPNKMVLEMEVVAKLNCQCIDKGTTTTIIIITITSLKITKVHQSKQWEKKNLYVKGMYRF